MTDYTELKRLVDRVLTDRRFCGDENHKALADGVQALIGENERLKTLRSTTERDLAQELEVWRHGPSCWSCGDTGDVHDMVGEWRGKCDCNAAKLIDAASDRAQLKAENEALRKDAERYRWLREGESGSAQDRMVRVFMREALDQEIDCAIKRESRP